MPLPVGWGVDGDVAFFLQEFVHMRPVRLSDMDGRMEILATFHRKSADMFETLTGG
jgi:hypothetical protein